MTSRYRLLIVDGAWQTVREQAVSAREGRFGEAVRWVGPGNDGYLSSLPCLELDPPLSDHWQHGGGVFADGRGGECVVEGYDTSFIGSAGPFPYVATWERIA